VVVGGSALEDLGVTMRVLVTGHRGYLGGVLVPHLRAAGHDVVGLDSGLFDACTFIAPPDVPALDLDIRDVEPEQRIIQRSGSQFEKAMLSGSRNVTRILRYLNTREPRA